MAYEYTITTTPEINKDDGYMYCGECGTKLILVVAFSDWAVDSEPFKDGEERPEDYPKEVFVGEVSGHFCRTCEQLTSLSYNH